MNKYLGFKSAGFDFLLDAKDVVEVFDVDASQEDVNKVLVGSDGDAYWRGTLSSLIDLTALLGGNQGVGHCYVVCRHEYADDKYHILKVDAITSLFDFSEDQFTNIDLNNENLKGITDKVCLIEEEDQMFLLISDIDKMFELSFAES